MKPLPPKDNEETTSGGSTEIDSALYKLIPETSVFNLSSGTWIEKNGYGALIFTGIAQDYDRNIGADLKAAGYSGSGGGYVWDAIKAEQRDYANPEHGGKLRTVYCGQTETFAIVVAEEELPIRYLCWLMVGLTEDELGEPYFEGSVYDYIPNPQGNIYLYLTDSDCVDGQYRYQLCKVDRARLNKYIDLITEAGYVETCREEPDDESMYFEADLKVYEEFEIYVTVQLAWYQDKLMIAYSEADKTMEKDAVWEGAKTYTGDKTGIDPNSEENRAAMDLANATSVETLGDRTVYYLDLYSVDAAHNYVKELESAGYKEEEPPYSPDIPSYYVELAHYWLVQEGMGDQSHVVVVASDKKAMVIMSKEKLTDLREHDLWDSIEYPIQFGMGYLETVFLDFYYNYGAMGDGQGWSSSGYYSTYGYGNDKSAITWAQKQLVAAGFSEYRTGSADGAEIWVYTRTDKYEYLSCTIYARLLLDGDFAELEFGYGFRNNSENQE